MKDERTKPVLFLFRFNETLRFESTKLGLIPRNLDTGGSSIFSGSRKQAAASQPFRYTAGGYVPPLRRFHPRGSREVRKLFPKGFSAVQEFRQLPRSNCAPALNCSVSNSFPGFYERPGNERNFVPRSDRSGGLSILSINILHAAKRKRKKKKKERRNEKTNERGETFTWCFDEFACYFGTAEKCFEASSDLLFE